MPGCLHPRVEPCLRWPRGGLVYVYVAAAACVADALSGVQKCPVVASAHRRRHTIYLVVFWNIIRHTQHAQSRGLLLESSAGCAGFWLEVLSSDGPFAADGCS